MECFEHPDTLVNKVKMLAQKITKKNKALAFAQE